MLFSCYKMKLPCNVSRQEKASYFKKSTSFSSKIFFIILKKGRKCVLLPKVSIFVYPGLGVQVDIKRATTNLNLLQEIMVPDLQTSEGIYQNLFRGRFANFPLVWNRSLRE